jgi:predicted dehydrogenase
VTTLVFDYPGHLLAELAVSAVFRGGNRLELYGDDGAIIGEDVLGSARGGTITCKGQAITYDWVNSFIGEVTDFVQAVQQQREPRVKLVDGMRNVHIMETARARQLQHPL